VQRPSPLPFKEISAATGSEVLDAELSTGTVNASFLKKNQRVYRKCSAGRWVGYWNRLQQSEH